MKPKYDWEISGFHFYRQVEDGIDFIDFKIYWDRYKGDHKPSFNIFISICNFVLLDFQIYNINHMEDIEDEN